MLGLSCPVWYLFFLVLLAMKPQWTINICNAFSSISYASRSVLYEFHSITLSLRTEAKYPSPYNFTQYLMQPGTVHTVDNWWTLLTAAIVSISVSCNLPPVSFPETGNKQRKWEWGRKHFLDLKWETIKITKTGK